MDRRTDAGEKDETETLRRIIEDCVRSQFRDLADPGDVDPHDLGYRVAREVMDRLRAARIDAVWR
jgi:hypothetical protein